MHLTPREFHERLDGWRYRYRKQEEMVAHFVAQLIRPHVKGRVTAEEVLGRPFNADSYLQRK